MTDFEMIKNMVFKVYDKTEIEVHTADKEEDIIFFGINDNGDYAFTLDFDKQGNFVGYTT